MFKYYVIPRNTVKYRIREFRAFRSLDHKIDTKQKKLEIDMALVRKELVSTNQEVKRK